MWFRTQKTLPDYCKPSGRARSLSRGAAAAERTALAPQVRASRCCWRGSLPDALQDTACPGMSLGFPALPSDFTAAAQRVAPLSHLPVSPEELRHRLSFVPATLSNGPWGPWMSSWCQPSARAARPRYSCQPGVPDPSITLQSCLAGCRAPSFRFLGSPGTSQFLSPLSGQEECPGPSYRPASQEQRCSLSWKLIKTTGYGYQSATNGLFGCWTSWTEA